LVERMEKLPRPEPPKEHSPASLDEYLNGWAAVQDVVRAESILRACTRYVSSGVLRTHQPGDMPLLTSGGDGLNHKDEAAPSTRVVQQPAPLEPGPAPASA
jgi:hypothetical protein